jgi:hypothetical protein
MTTAERSERLVAKLELQAAEECRRQWERESLEIVQRNTRQPPTTSQNCRKQLTQLRTQTAEIELALKLRKEVETETKRNLQAKMKLLEAQRSPAEQQAYEAEIRRGQILYSRVVEENDPDWRRQPLSNLEFYRQQTAKPLKNK